MEIENDALSLKNEQISLISSPKKRKKSFYVLLIFLGILLICIVALFYKLDAAALLLQKSYPETELRNSQILVVSSADSKFDNLNYPSKSDLKIISFDEEGNKKEEVVDSLDGHENHIFVTGTIMASKAVYIVQEGTIYRIFAYDIATKDKKILDQIDAPSPPNTGNSHSNFDGKVAVKLVPALTEKKLFFYHNGALEIYSLDNGSKTEIKLWEKVTDSDWDKGPVRNIKLKPGGEENIATSNYDIFEDPNDTIYQNGQLNFLFSNLYFQEADSSLEYICGKNYSSLGDDWISSSASSIRCGVDSDYGCEVSCPPKNIYLGLNKYNDNYFTEFNDIVQKNAESYVLTRTIDLMDINCGGYFQIGPCISNHVDTIASLNESGEQVRYEHYGYMNYTGQRVNNLTLSSNGNFVAYSLLDNAEKDVYVLDLSKNTRPSKVDSRSFPLYIGIDEDSSSGDNLVFPEFQPTDNPEVQAQNAPGTADSETIGQISPGLFDDDYMRISYDPETFYPKKSDIAPNGDIIRSYDVLAYGKPRLEDYIFKSIFITFYKNTSGMNNDQYLKNITPNPNDPNAFTDQIEKKKLGNTEYVKSRIDKGKAMYYENMTKNYDLRIQCNAPDNKLFSESDISIIENFISSITFKR